MALHADDFLAEIRDCEQGVARFNRWLGERITRSVATMWCAYAFAALALVSLPAVLASRSLLNIVAWIAQTFLQLVLLAIILYGQNLAAEKSDARADATYQNSDDAEKRLERIERKLNLAILTDKEPT